MNAPIDLLVVDDHRMIRDGIRASLSSVAHLRVADEAADGEEALTKLAQHPEVRVVVMDISLGGREDGVAVTRRMTEQFPAVRVLALTMHDEEAHITSMLQAGAAGYLLKATGMSELVTAIETVAQGESYFSQEVSATMMRRFMKHQASQNPSAISSPEQLTRREREVLVLIAEGYTNPEIAEKLFISPRTVDTHRRNLILKLDAKNTAGLVRYAIKYELVEL